MPRRKKRQQPRGHIGSRKRPPHPIRAISSGLGVVVVAGFLAWVQWTRLAPQETLPDPPAWLPQCPIGGGPVNFAHCLATEDGPVFFCCEHCMKRFNDDPSPFSTQVGTQREALQRLPHIQVVCPVSGDPIDPTLHVDSLSGPVYFCSPACRDQYADAPRQYRGGLASSYWYQVICPVDGHEIDHGFSTTLPAGERVYFCSEHCRNELKRKPREYAAQLARQGIRLHGS